MALNALDVTRASSQTARTAAEACERAILAKAFRGELVPQDPNDEPAEQMLARLANTEAPTKSKRGRWKKDP